MKKSVLIVFVVAAIMALATLATLGYSLRTLRFIIIPSGSMANTIIPGDRVIVSTRFSEIKRGDIVLFNFPRNQRVKYVSRIIGLPGETLSVRDMSVFINGQELPEHRVMVELLGPDAAFNPEVQRGPRPPGATYQVYYNIRQHNQVTENGDALIARFATNGEVTVPPDKYFVLGDNRDNSFDSRFWGFVPRASIIGKPISIYFSAPTREQSNNGKTRWGRLFTSIK